MLEKSLIRLNQTLGETELFPIAAAIALNQRRSCPRGLEDVLVSAWSDSPPPSSRAHRTNALTTNRLHENLVVNATWILLVSSVASASRSKHYGKQCWIVSLFYHFVTRFPSRGKSELLPKVSVEKKSRRRDYRDNDNKNLQISNFKFRIFSWILISKVDVVGCQTW